MPTPLLSVVYPFAKILILSESQRIHDMFNCFCVVYPFAKILILSESQLVRRCARRQTRCLSICKDTNFKRITTVNYAYLSFCRLFIHLQRY